MTIDEAIEFLNKARSKLGGEACLILSLTGSEIEDVDIDGMDEMVEPGSFYVQVRAQYSGNNRM
jgi:hypothetical protein